MRRDRILALLLVAFSLPARALRDVTTADQIAKRQTIAQLLGEVPVLQEMRRELFRKLDAVRSSVDPDPVQQRAIEVNIRAINHSIAALGEGAVALTLEIYGIGPTDTGRQILDKSDYLGSAANWGVRFSQSKSYTAFNPRTKKPETFSFNSPNVLGVTWADGAITVTEKALQSPGILAATLLHETVHFDQRTLPHGARVDMTGREVAAFGKALNDEVQRKLGLTPADVKYLRGQHAAFMAAPEAYLPQVGGSASPFIGTDPPADVVGFGEFGADGEALARLNNQSAELRGSIESATANRSQQFIDRMNAGANTVAAAFRTEATSACNLMAVNAEADQYKVRVGRGQPVILRYADADGFYVAALLTQACTVPWQATPCNDAMAILNRRWGDKAFRESVVPAAGTDERIGHCFWHLVKRLKPTDDFQKVRKGVADFEESNRPESGSQAPSPPVVPRAPREREVTPTRPPDIPHCRRSGPWCDGTQDSQP